MGEVELAHLDPRFLGERDDIRRADSTRGIDDDRRGSLGVGNGIVVLQVREPGCFSRDRKPVPRQVVDVSRDAEAAQMPQHRQLRRDLVLRRDARRRDHAEVEPRVVRDDRVVADEFDERFELLRPRARAGNAFFRDAVQLHIERLKVVVPGGRMNEPARPFYDSAVANPHEPHPARRRGGAVRGLEIDRGEINGHRTMVAPTTDTASALDSIVR